MKNLSTYLFLSLTIWSSSVTGQNIGEDFKVTIDETVMFGGSHIQITPDSIHIRTQYNLKETRITEFKKALNKNEAQKLRKAFSTIDLKHLKDSYIGKDVSDDNYEFEFTFNVNGSEKRTRIYEYKHKEIFEFVRQVNLLIEKDFAINYDERYCSTNVR